MQSGRGPGDPSGDAEHGLAAEPTDVTAWARWKLIAASASAILVLVVGAVAFITNRLIADAGGVAAPSRQAVAVTRQIQTSLRDAEASVRGFLLTGDTSHLATFATRQDTIGRAIARLRPLLAANGGRTARLDTLEALSTAKLAELARAVSVRREQDLAAASRLVQADASRHLTNAISEVTTALIADETARLAARQAVQRRRARLAAILIVVATLLAFVLAATANLTLYRAVRGLARAADAQRRLGAERLAVATENERLYREASGEIGRAHV